jgi:hypothetical protein
MNSQFLKTVSIILAIQCYPIIVQSLLTHAQLANEEKDDSLENFSLFTFLASFILLITNIKLPALIERIGRYRVLMFSAVLLVLST